MDDLDAARAELSLRGVQFRSRPVTVDAGANKGAKGLYLLDPDAITVELFRRAG